MPKFDCELCRKAWAMIVLNGRMWLCWDCYCKACEFREEA